VYVDAALLYQTGSPEALRQWIAEEQVLMADAGTPADEFVIREARRRGCPALTNDRMEEWDPEDEVLKWRFTIYGDRVVIENGLNGADGSG